MAPTSTGPADDVQLTVKSVVVPLYDWLPLRGVSGVLSVIVTVKLYGPAGSANVPEIVKPTGSQTRPGGNPTIEPLPAYGATPPLGLHVSDTGCPTTEGSAAGVQFGVTVCAQTAPAAIAVSAMDL